MADGRQAASEKADSPDPQGPALEREHPVMASLGHESESKHLARIIDSIPSLIHTGRPDGYLDYFNQNWLDYVGLPMEALQGWKWTVAIHPEDVETILERWRFSIA